MKKLIFLFILSTLSIYAQDSRKKADKYYTTANFEKAAEAYASIVNQGTTDVEIIKRAADSFYFVSKFESAEPLYSMLVNDFKESIDDVYIFRYAQTLKALKKNKEADKWMKTYEKEVSDVVYKANLDKLEAIKKQGNKFEVKNLALNTAGSDFGPAFYNNGIVFSTPAKTGEKYKWTNQNYLDLYTAKIENDKIDSLATPFSKELNSKVHESNIALSKDGNTIYFTRNNLTDKGKKQKDKNKITNIGIYKATLVDGIWTDIKPLAINNSEYSVMHPALNKDNTRLYFSSDMPGSIGSFDIFYATIDGSGEVGTPVNLGPEINTKTREHFPFIGENNRLYFASDGHTGFGLLDVFMCEWIEETFTKPLNVGLPVNTNADDFSFIIDEEAKRGFFSSNREEGKGDDDIYGYLKTKPVENFKYYVEGAVKDIDSGKLIDNAVVTLYDEKDNEVAKMTFLEASTTYRFDLLKTGTYKVVATHPLYIQAEKTFTVLDNGTEKNVVDIKMTAIPDTFLKDLVADEGEPRVITEDGVLMFDLKEILFDYDKSNIRADAKVDLNKLIAKLKKYPLVKLEIGSHTDSRGSDEYNQILSQDRAVSTRRYIVESGISGDRITAAGYGETRPKVNCAEKECSEGEHQINRRSEFVILVDTKIKQ